jgi:5-(aminomethyl)-3-furanmethanol phosphate kinase
MTAAPPPPLVVKVGGSVVSAGCASLVVEHLVSMTLPVVIVPGGGAFADKVRADQIRDGFDDATAHRLALRAMDAMAGVLAAQHPRLRQADSISTCLDVLAAGHVPVWTPWPEVAADPTLPASWQTTSDAIAARLAERIGAAAVVLIKSVDAGGHETASELAAAGIVDPVFAGIVARSRIRWWIAGPASYGHLAASLMCRIGPQPKS